MERALLFLFESVICRAERSTESPRIADGKDGDAIHAIYGASVGDAAVGAVKMSFNVIRLSKANVEGTRGRKEAEEIQDTTKGRKKGEKIIFVE